MNARNRTSVGADARPEGSLRSHRLNGSGSSLVKDLKLLFAALGAGNSVVPLGDNSRAARLLSEYAKSLRAN
jgi:hypothetical protein